jgi:hypothetical protein
LTDVLLAGEGNLKERGRSPLSAGYSLFEKGCLRGVKPLFSYIPLSNRKESVLCDIAV